MAHTRIIFACSTPLALAALYRSTLNLRLRIARQRKASGWASTSSPGWGGVRVTYIPQHDGRQMALSMLFPPLLLFWSHKMLWWELLSVPEALVDDTG